MRRIAGWVVATVCLLLACFLLIQSWVSLNASPEQSNTAGSVLLITAADQNAGQYRLLRTGLIAAGFAVADCQIDIDTKTNWQTIQAAADQLNGSAPSATGVWLVSSGNAAVKTWLAGSQMEGVAGILMLTPQNIASLSTQDIENRLKGIDVAVFAAPDINDGINDASRAFFEQLSGEDTTLFPAFQQNIFKPLQYASSNGKTWLMIYPGLTSNWSLLSVRVLPDVVSWLTDWSSANTPRNTEQSNQAAKHLIILVIQIILAGILLLAVPLGLNFALAAQTSHQVESASIGKNRLINILLWLPGAALAAALSLLLVKLTGNQTGWLMLALLLLPGSRGWLYVLSNLINGNRQAGSTKNTSNQDQKRYFLLATAGLLAIVLTILAAVCWDWLAFGSLQLTGLSWLLLPIVIIVGWPAGLAGTSGRSIWQYLPFLLLPFWSVIAYGLSGLAASLLLLAVLLWSVSLGKAVTRLSFHPSIGSLVQAIGWTTCLFIPSITNVF